MEILGRFLLFLSLISDTTDLGLDLQNLVVSLFDELFDCLESLISLLHSKETLLPVLKQGLLAHNNSLDLDGSFLKRVPCSSRFFLLGDQLGLVERFLLIQPLDFLVHSVNEQILLLL